MTLNDFYAFAASHHSQVVFYFALVPFAALLAGFMERREGHLPPWNYLYSAMLYLVAIPAVFSVGLTAYRWLFERSSIMEADLVLQIVPVISLILTVLFIRRQVSLRALPGFGRLSGLVLLIAAGLILLWGIDRTRIILFSQLPMQYLVAVFLLLLIVLRYGFKRVVG
ncbi:hypothetical protein LEM8419_00164 [Neolewinella maritima]|uniref:Uncharacterized protein n=1 Tax=Neolewinella maritima TaxID=1383882 RepID=A0ABM9AW00_9BACT|nr:hypothetical protein [Neolewinella maritima]CAH0998849.1 hypothetical protein LEM8419_00164 [Neolewinella maritima]